MIIRDYVICKTCGHNHIVRIQVGSGGRQLHSFNCSGCKEPIKLALDVNNEDVSTELHCLENCEQITESVGTPVYLSSLFVANREKINQEMSFPFFDFLGTINNSSIGKKLIRQAEATQKPNVHEEWNELKKIWRLENSNQHSIAKDMNMAFAKRHDLPSGTLSENLWYFLNGLYPMSVELRTELKYIIDNYRSEFVSFIYFYKLKIRPMHRHSQFQILSEFFDSFHEHSQVFPYVRIKASLPKLSKATSIDFNKVKTFYASAYEFFAGSICLYTCLNNIKEGRPFDKLKNIPLEKYLETDKAKRRDSILSNPVFTSLTEEFDSKIRNASYHNWLFLRQDNETIEYRSGGTGLLETMTYAEYLYKCGVLFSQICQIFSLELELDQIALDLGLFTFVTKRP